MNYQKRKIKKSLKCFKKLQIIQTQSDFVNAVNDLLKKYRPNSESAKKKLSKKVEKRPKNAITLLSTKADRVSASTNKTASRYHVETTIRNLIAVLGSSKTSLVLIAQIRCSIPERNFNHFVIRQV